MTKILKLQLLLFTVLLLLWNIFTPVLEGADESGHFCHADYISQRNKLPDLRIKDGCFLWHGPLYYLTLVPILKISGLPEFSSNQIETNPRFSLLRKGEYAQFVHSKDELLFKWNKFQTTIHLSRLVSSIYGIGVFILAIKASKLVFKKENQRALSLLLFFNPMFLHIFSTLTNVTLLSFISASLFLLELKNIKTKKSHKTFFIQGILFGLGYLTKVSFLVFAVYFLLISIYRIKKRVENVRSTLKGAAIFSIAFFLVAGWYLARSIILYGTPLEINILAQEPGPHHHDDLLEEVGPLNYFNSFFLTLFRTFWSGYGALTIRFPDFVNTQILIFSTLIITSIIKNWSKANIYIKTSLLYLTAIFLGLLLSNLRMAAMHAKDLFPAYVPLSFLFAYGVANINNAVKKGKKLILFSAPIPIYFFAQIEIVTFIKSVSQNTIDYSVISSILWKLVFVISIYMMIFVNPIKFKTSPRTLMTSTLFLFGANIIILSISTFLFYFKFI